MGIKAVAVISLVAAICISILVWSAFDTTTYAQGDAEYGDRLQIEDIPLHPNNDHFRGIEFGNWDGVHYMFVYDYSDRIVYAYRTDSGSYVHERSLVLPSSRGTFNSTTRSIPRRNLLADPSGTSDFDARHRTAHAFTLSAEEYNRGYNRADDGIYEGFVYDGDGVFFFIDNSVDTANRTNTYGTLHYPSLLVRYAPFVGSGESGVNGMASVLRCDDYTNTNNQNRNTNPMGLDCDDYATSSNPLQFADGNDILDSIADLQGGNAARFGDDYSGNTLPPIKDIELDGTEDDNGWTAYGATSVRDTVLIRYSYRDSSSTVHYYWGAWSRDGATSPLHTSNSRHEIESEQTTTEGGESLISLTALRFAVDIDNGVIYFYDDVVTTPDDSSNNRGMAAYEYDALVTRGRLVRDDDRGIITIRENGENIAVSVGGASYRSDGDNDILYAVQSNSTYASGVAVYAYQAGDALIGGRGPSTLGALAQSPPAISIVTSGVRDTERILQWIHTSSVLDGVTTMEREWWTNDNPNAVQQQELDPYPSMETIPNLLNRTYTLILRLRYKWENNSTGEILIRNPPNSDNVCDDLDEPDDPDDDTDDDNTEVDTTTPGCAFYLAAGEIRYSPWTQSSINITSFPISVTQPPGGLGPGVQRPPAAPLPTDEDFELPRHYWGLPSAIGEFLIVMGQAPDQAAPLARTFSILIWLVVCTGVAAGVYYGTGIQTGSMYLATLLWLILWTGLGQFIAGVPTAMAYWPTAILLFGIGLLVVKRGKL